MSLAPTAFHRLTLAAGGPSATAALLQPYAITISAEPDIRLEMGRFSCALLPLLMVLGAGQRFSCGAFCEAAPSARIVVGGEHDNGSLWNLTLGPAAQAFGAFTPSEEGPSTGLVRAAPIRFGDNVILSTGAIVLAGATIGDGTVIGAGAVVTGACDPMSIYAGVPARLLRPRFPPERETLYRAARLTEAHAHHMPMLPSLLSALGEGALPLEDYLAQVSFLKARPRLHFTARVTPTGAVQDLSLADATVDDRAVDPAAFARIKAYVSQRGPEIEWTPDIFHSLGLC